MCRMRGFWRLGKHVAASWSLLLPVGWESFRICDTRGADTLIWRWLRLCCPRDAARPQLALLSVLALVGDHASSPICPSKQNSSLRRGRSETAPTQISFNPRKSQSETWSRPRPTASGSCRVLCKPRHLDMSSFTKVVLVREVRGHPPSVLQEREKAASIHRLEAFCCLPHISGWSCTTFCSDSHPFPSQKSTLTQL